MSIYVRYGEANSLGFRPFMAEVDAQAPNPTSGSQVDWVFPDGTTEVPAFTPVDALVVRSVDDLLNWCTQQENMTWIPVGKRWPLIGPPNAEAQKAADEKYHRTGRGTVDTDEPPKGDGRYQPDTFAGRLHAIYDDAFGLCLRKHHDYGPLNIALAPGGPINGLRVRMHDKMARINHLVESGREPGNEALRDSFVDLANYAMIALMVIDKHWPGVPD